MRSKLMLLTILSFATVFAYAQQSQNAELPLTDEALTLFNQAIFLSNFASLNCQNVNTNTPLIQASIEAIRNMNYQIFEYAVGFGTMNNLYHRYYLRTFDPPALVELLILSNSDSCDDFSFSLIDEETLNASTD